MFEACTDGDDPPSTEDQHSDFRAHLHSFLLGEFFSREEGLRHLLTEAVSRHIPWDCRAADCYWTVQFNGGELGRGASPQVTSFNVGEKREHENHKLVCFVSKDSEIIYEVTSRKELTPERLIRYMKKEHEYEDREDGDDWITHDPVGTPIDLDEWEAKNPE